MADQIELRLEQALDFCLKCNICTAACPVAAVTDLFPGPKYVGPQAERFRATGVDTRHPIEILHQAYETYDNVAGA